MNVWSEEFKKNRDEKIEIEVDEMTRIVKDPDDLDLPAGIFYSASFSSTLEFLQRPTIKS